MNQTKGYLIADQYTMHFVTFTIVGWVDLFTRKECKDIFIESLKYCTREKGLVIHAYVIMPSHVHLIISAQEDSAGLSAIIRDIKKHTSKEFIKWTMQSGRESRREWLKVIFKYHAKYNKNNSLYQVWKQDNQPKALIHPKFTSQKVNYIHNNPVDSGIVLAPEDYLYSSARNYMNRDDILLNVEIIDYGTQEGYVAL